MNYKKHYDRLIIRGQGRLLEGYSEKHHIVPRCIGGSNDATNLVALTAEEHYVAHQLLVKIYPKNHKLIYAARMMTIGSNGNRVNNKLYGWLKRKYASCPGIKHTKETRAKMSFSLLGNKRGCGNKGKKLAKRTSEHKHNLSLSQKGRPKERIFCDYCERIIAGPANFKRWHGDNCKSLISTLI